MLSQCPAGSNAEALDEGGRGRGGGAARGRRRTRFRLMAHDAGFFVAPPAEGNHQGEQSTGLPTL